MLLGCLVRIREHLSSRFQWACSGVDSEKGNRTEPLKFRYLRLRNELNTD